MTFAAVFKLLNDRKSEFKESNELIMYKLSHNMSTEKFQASKLLDFSVFENLILHIFHIIIIIIIIIRCSGMFHVPGFIDDHLFSC